MKIDLSPRDIGKIVDDTLILYRANFKSLVLGSLALLFPVVLIASVAGGAYYQSIIELMLSDLGLAGSQAYAQPPETMAVLGALQTLMYMTVPIRFVALVWLGSSVYRSTPLWMAERRQGVVEFLKSGRHRVVQLGVVQVGMWIITQVVMGIVFFAAFLLSALLAAALVAAGSAGVILGIMMVAIVVIAGVFAYTWALSWLQAWGPSVVIEESGVGQALSRSVALVKGNSLRTVWYWWTVWMVSYAIRALIYAPATLVFINTVLPFIQDPQTATIALPLWVTMFLGVSAAAAEAVVLPFERACWAQYYLDLRSRAEGMDLVVRAREMSTATT